MTASESIASADPRRLADWEGKTGGLPIEFPDRIDAEWRSGSIIHPPHINSSGAETVRIADGPKGGSILLGLGAVRGLSAAFVVRILSLRSSGGSYLSISDALARLHPERREARLLARSGCLDDLPACGGGLPLTRPQSLWLIHHLMREGSSPAPFFAEFIPEIPRCIGDYSIEARREDGLACLGIDLFPSFVDSSGAS